MPDYSHRFDGVDPNVCYIELAAIPGCSVFVNRGAKRERERERERERGREREGERERERRERGGKGGAFFFLSFLFWETTPRVKGD